MLVEHFTATLPFKPKNWVLCHQPQSLEEAVMLMEAYGSAEVGLYLIPKSWKRKGEGRGALPGKSGRWNRWQQEGSRVRNEADNRKDAKEEGITAPLTMQRPHTWILT